LGDKNERLIFTPALALHNTRAIAHTGRINTEAPALLFVSLESFRQVAPALVVIAVSV